MPGLQFIVTLWYIGLSFKPIGPMCECVTVCACLCLAV